MRAREFGSILFERPEGALGACPRALETNVRPRRPRCKAAGGHERAWSQVRRGEPNKKKGRKERENGKCLRHGGETEGGPSGEERPSDNDSHSLREGRSTALGTSAPPPRRPSSRPPFTSAGEIRLCFRAEQNNVK